MNSERNEPRALSFRATCVSKGRRGYHGAEFTERKRISPPQSCSPSVRPLCIHGLSKERGGTCTRVRTNARTPTKRRPLGSKSLAKPGIVNFWRFPLVAMHQPRKVSVYAKPRSEVKRSRTESNGVKQSRTESNGVKQSQTKWNEENMAVGVFSASYFLGFPRTLVWTSTNFRNWLRLTRAERTTGGRNEARCFCGAEERPGAMKEPRGSEDEDLLAGETVRAKTKRKLWEDYDEAVRGLQGSWKTTRSIHCEDLILLS